jgi:RHH-type proline utilization regulon transcriptional repressor/proline dehydrogenase/delta 1-pyrroline-5-carboxylate dehydrogenase
MLYGMAESIARSFRVEGFLVRLYVPLGEMIPGMGYLVRRLLENTSNESFLKHTFYDARDHADLLAEPRGRFEVSHRNGTFPTSVRGDSASRFLTEAEV